MDCTISFSWWDIDGFIDVLERFTKLEDPAEKIKEIKKTFTNKFRREMTAGSVVKALEANLKERESDSADWDRLQALKELLFINLRNAYEPNPILIWRAYTLCRQIQLSLPGLLRNLDGIGERFAKIITEEAGTSNPFHYALGMDQGRGQSFLSDTRLFDRRWQAQYHPENDIFINDEPVDNRTLQRYKKWMKDFTNSKLSDMVP
ncbi:MAG: hypothetical protein GY874_04455 [Desulfobacteraceae bacterium]|nr:hypothetical protein [Desulfobacteraceae bacterium]